MLNPIPKYPNRELGCGRQAGPVLGDFDTGLQRRREDHTPWGRAACLRVPKVCLGIIFCFCAYKAEENIKHVIFGPKGG